MRSDDAGNVPTPGDEPFPAPRNRALSLADASSAGLDELFLATERPNVVLITLDCCRFDTAARAQTPALDRLGPLRRAITPGSFTLPAHMAFFSGYLPNVVELPHQDYYSRERRQLWRLSRAKSKPRDSFRLGLEGDTLWEGFRRAGYHTVGAGGVRWFLTKTLTEPFDEFVFAGPNDYVNWFAERSLSDFVLEDPAPLVGLLPRAAPWFLFVNALETHAPYNDGVNPVSDQVADIIRRGAPIWAGRKRHALDVDLSTGDFQALHRQQIQALEVLDARIARLFEQLPKPFVAVVCGDHGECFGEDGMWGHGMPAEAVMNVPMYVGAVLE